MAVPARTTTAPSVGAGAFVGRDVDVSSGAGGCSATVGSCGHKYTGHSHIGHNYAGHGHIGNSYTGLEREGPFLCVRSAHMRLSMRFDTRLDVGIFGDFRGMPTANAEG